MSADETPRLIDLAHEAPFALGAAQVRPATREVTAGERREVLEPRVMQVLVALARRRGEVVSRDDLTHACWGGRSVSEDAIHRAIAAVRRLAQSLGGFSIETVARVGYRLSEAPAPTRASTALAWLTRLPTPMARPWAWALGLAAIVALAGAGAWLWRDTLSPPPIASEARVAVLPFDTLGPSQDERYFADRLTDEVLGVLSANQVLALSRTETLSLRGPAANLAIDRLGAALLLDGSVERNGPTLRVRVHLDDAREHVTLWSQVFDGSASQPETLQARVAARATELTSWALIARSDRSGAIDAMTLSDFIEAVDQMETGGGRAEAILRQVTAHAPGFAPGHSVLAIVLGDSDEARSEARRSIQLDPTNGTPYVALALSTRLVDWDQREAFLRKGRSVDPNLVFLPYVEDSLLAQAGRNRDALAAAQRAVALRPLTPFVNASLAARLASAGAFAQAGQVVDRTAQLWPNDPFAKRARFFIAVQSQLSAVALSLLDAPESRPLDMTPASAALWRTVLEARDSRGAPAIQAARSAVRTAAEAGQIGRLDAMFALATLGDVDGAFLQADRYYTARRLNQGPGAGFIEDSFLFAPATAAMRQDPRFMTLAARLGLVNFWRSTGAWPDFCAEPGLPYDCRTEAAHVAPAVSPRA